MTILCNGFNEYVLVVARLGAVDCTLFPRRIVGEKGKKFLSGITTEMVRVKLLSRYLKYI